MKFISKNDKKILIVLLLAIIFGWLIYLTVEKNRIDNNFNLYTKSISEQNSKRNTAE